MGLTKWLMWRFLSLSNLATQFSTTLVCIQTRHHYPWIRFKYKINWGTDSSHRTLPEVWAQNFFATNIFFRNQIFSGQNFFWTQSFFLNFIWTQKIFSDLYGPKKIQILFWTLNCFDPKIFGTQNFFDPKFNPEQKISNSTFI